MRTALTHAAAAAAAVLVLAGCGPAAETTREPPTTTTTSPSPGTEPSTEQPATEQPGTEQPATEQPGTEQPEPAAAEGPTLPPELAARMPPEDEIDSMVEEARAAYLDHRVVYDAAARTGFTDPDLLEKLFATATGDVLGALEAEATAMAAAGQVVDGEAQVVGMDLYSLVVPEEDGTGFGVVLDVCLHLEGALQESDGTVVLELDGEPIYVVVRVIDRGTWLVATQSVQDGPCPEGLPRP